MLSKAEMWSLLQAPDLLKHKILIGLLYGCGLRCLEARSVRIQDIDMDRRPYMSCRAKRQERSICAYRRSSHPRYSKYLDAENPDTAL
ncbi:MAG: tyrosine-type recombinase/integrase [Saprospiraceae bacterium]|nr:tyrosine-type recombinase/integrase [Saprospiraceae bacterium]